MTKVVDRASRVLSWVVIAETPGACVDQRPLETVPPLKAFPPGPVWFQQRLAEVAETGMRIGSR